MKSLINSGGDINLKDKVSHRDYYLVFVYYKNLIIKWIKGPASCLNDIVVMLNVSQNTETSLSLSRDFETLKRFFF